METMEHDPELEALIRDNADPELKRYWGENAGKHMRDADPERYEKVCEEIAARDASTGLMQSLHGADRKVCLSGQLEPHSARVEPSSRELLRCG